MKGLCKNSICVDFYCSGATSLWVEESDGWIEFMGFYIEFHMDVFKYKLYQD